MCPATGPLLSSPLLEGVKNNPMLLSCPPTWSPVCFLYVGAQQARPGHYYKLHRVAEQGHRQPAL